LAALQEIVGRAGKKTLDYFDTDRYQVERKSDQSPVTIADRAAEQLVRDELANHFGEDGLLGEEFGPLDHCQPGQTSERCVYRWIVDPIDGTKSFIAGVPLYSTLLGLEYRGQMLAGAIMIPALGELAVACVGQGAWYRGQQDTNWRPCHVSTRATLSEAIFLVSQVDSFAKYDSAAAYERLQNDCWITRSWGDAYGYLLVATGRADIMVDPIVNPWDVAAVLPVVQEAGGSFTDWHGLPTIEGKNGVGTNGLLHHQVLERLRPSRAEHRVRDLAKTE
jgi:histidinol phosphatase-like enzyme (inositol monophosphatase family)